MSSTPNYLSDANWRPLGYTTQTPLGQIELRTPNSIYLGSYDPVANVTRNANGMPIGNGNLLGLLIKRPFGL